MSKEGAIKQQPHKARLTGQKALSGALFMLAIPNCKKNEKLLNASPGLRQRFAQDDAAAFVIPSGAKGASAFNLNGISASRSTGACDVEITRAATAEKQALTGPSG